VTYNRFSGSKRTILDIVLLPYEDTLKTVTDPGTAYVEGALWAASNEGRNTIDFSIIKAHQCRIVTVAQGNEAGAGKGVCIYNVTDGAVLCEVTWDGVGSARRVGSWTAMNLNKEIVVGVYCKGSSATEDFTTVGTTHLQLLVEN